MHPSLDRPSDHSRQILRQPTLTGLPFSLNVQRPPIRTVITAAATTTTLSITNQQHGAAAAAAAQPPNYPTSRPTEIARCATTLFCIPPPCIVVLLLSSSSGSRPGMVEQPYLSRRLQILTRPPDPRYYVSHGGLQAGMKATVFAPPLCEQPPPSTHTHTTIWQSRTAPTASSVIRSIW